VDGGDLFPPGGPITTRPPRRTRSRRLSLAQSPRGGQWALGHRRKCKISFFHGMPTQNPWDFAQEALGQKVARRVWRWNLPQNRPGKPSRRTNVRTQGSASPCGRLKVRGGKLGAQAQGRTPNTVGRARRGGPLEPRNRQKKGPGGPAAAFGPPGAGHKARRGAERDAGVEVFVRSSLAELSVSAALLGGEILGALHRPARGRHRRERHPVRVAPLVPAPSAGP